MGICPLCRVAHKSDREYVWQLSEEGSGDEETMSAISRAHGFCAEHAEMLRRVDAGVKSMLGLSSMYAEVLGDLQADLAARDVSRQTEVAACPGCANRDAAVGKNAQYLLGMLGSGIGGFADRFAASAGLCFPHFDLVWNTGGSADARRLVLDVQARVVTELASELGEFIRKEGVEFRYEPKGREQDAWQRAMWLTSGWPAPAVSAGIPEATADPDRAVD